FSSCLSDHLSCLPCCDSRVSGGTGDSVRIIAACFPHPKPNRAVRDHTAFPPPAHTSWTGHPDPSCRATRCCSPPVAQVGSLLRFIVPLGDDLVVSFTAST